MATGVVLAAARDLGDPVSHYSKGAFRGGRSRPSTSQIIPDRQALSSCLINNSVSPQRRARLAADSHGVTVGGRGPSRRLPTCPRSLASWALRGSSGRGGG